jgi:outer membrane beta-barrel protein
MKTKWILTPLALLGFLSLTPLSAHADEKAAPSASPAASSEGEALDVSKITQKYWAQGKDTELGVVQNRKYTTAHKIELEVFTGVISSDPFLNVNQFGASLGYHFDQYFSLHAIAWKAAVTPSDAFRTLEAPPTSTTPNTNNPKGFYGLEGDVNLLYGKVSVLGKMIIYVDIFLLGGAGITSTETGNDFTPFLGIGQKIHLNEFMAIQLDYRVMRYNETIDSKAPATLSNFLGTRANTTDAVTLGLSFTY